jgi:DNA repair protein RecO (recombination protein O)
VLQPFQPLLLSWISRGDLGTLTAAEAVPGVASLPSQRVYSGYYMNELLVRLTRRHDAHTSLFDHYRDALDGLLEGQPENRVLRLFEKNLLDELGYGLDLTRTVDGDAVADSMRYEYRLEHGIVKAGPGAADSMVFNGTSLLSLAAGKLEDEAVLSDAQRLLRAALEVYLGSRPLEARRVARAVRRSLR